ncbi:MAG: asparagine synthase (glutamine-hydrolyzing) [Bacteroidia bacterium]|nr:asparagine synthase (glutamine-hydrolyzing) [Bacteroidia bacterium]
MCGITGFYTEKEIDRQGVLTKMMDAIKHRGPDDSGAEHIDNYSFGHLRLSIIDLEHGHQPMFSEDKRYVISFNGEIYNYLELRQQLVQKGHNMKTYSDTEVLLNMYIAYGKDMLNHLNGMFAFVLYDKETKELLIARDHFGIKPFYYYLEDGDLVYASEIKSILQHPKCKAELNSEAIFDYLTFQLIPDQSTLFNKIKKLEPASYMIFREGKIIDQKTYWNPDYNIDEAKSEDEFADELLLLVENSLSIQTRSDVPVGAYLSGGIDSSVVAILAAKNFFGDFETFTGGFKEGPLFDETNYAQIVSKKIHSVHHEIFPTAQDFIDNFEKLVYHMDEPAAGPGLFPQYMVSKLASENVKVVLGGQGGDEVFGGYTRYAVAYLEQCIKGAIFETQEEGKHVVTLSSLTANLPQLKKYIPMIKSQFADGMFDDMDKRYYRLIDRSLKLQQFYTQDFLADRNEDKVFERFANIFNFPETPSYFNKMTHYDMKTLLPALLQVEDRVSMAVSLESRVPLLDKRIIELAAKMPPTMKFAGGRTKHILIESVKNILPKEILNRKDKMGFPTPLNVWLNGPLREFALDLMTGETAKNRGLFNTANIEKQITESSQFSRDLWGAMNIEMWFRKFID